MNEHDAFWAMLPDGLEEYFELKSIEKDGNRFRIVLIERNILPNDLPPEYQRKKVIDNTLNDLIIDYFPIKGRKGEILLKRRSWKFEGVDKWLKRKIDICAPGTKLEKEFADFLKELDRD